MIMLECRGREKACVKVESIDFTQGSMTSLEEDALWLYLFFNPFVLSGLDNYPLFLFVLAHSHLTIIANIQEEDKHMRCCLDLCNDSTGADY